MSEEFSSSEINKAQDDFKKQCDAEGRTCKRDTIFNKSHGAGKGDSPRSISKTYRDNYDTIFRKDKKKSKSQNAGKKSSKS